MLLLVLPDVKNAKAHIHIFLISLQIRLLPYKPLECETAVGLDIPMNAKDLILRRETHPSRKI